MHNKARSDDCVVYEARVFKTGNSLAIRISSTIAKQTQLEDGTSVEIVVDQGVMHVRKAPSRKLTDLIELITPQNIHEAAFDDLVGAENW